MVLFEDTKEDQAKIVKAQKHDQDVKKTQKRIYVNFRNEQDVQNFAKLLGVDITEKVKVIHYPINNLFLDTQSVPIEKLVKKSNKTQVWHKAWKEMPDFVQENNPAYKQVHVYLAPGTLEQFSKQIGQNLTDLTKSIWHPKLTIDANRKKRWIISEGHEEKMPRYPLYIVSKGRYEKSIRGTANSLERMRVPFYMVVEEQEYDKYLETADPDYCTVIVLDNQYKIDYDTFDGIDYETNPRVGPGAARNFAWDHAKNNGFDKYWVFDDNIDDFYRLHENFRIRVESGVMFRACEDFVDRYENVPVSGLQYRFFIAPNGKYPPFVFNTRVYSALLIDTNMEQYKWRGRYNEDTDLTLRVLKDGLCTCQFNAFLIGKAATQTTKGGNTDEFYAVEDQEDVVLHGTSNKSDMLKEMHPDVTDNVWKYGRWHHHVNYLPFKKNKPIMKKGLELKNEINNYGLELITNFST
jgi:hypothetical protein